MSVTKEPATSTLRFKPWKRVRNEVLQAIREATDDPIVQSYFPSCVHVEGYPGVGVSTAVFRATWRTGTEDVVYRVRIYLDRDATGRSEVLH